MNFPPRKIINRNIYLFIYNLLKYIFIGEDKLRKNSLEKINLFIKIANRKIYHRIKKSSKNEKTTKNTKKLTTEYSKENFKNIISFLKQQNPIYVGDILDIILTQIFSFAMQFDHNESMSEKLFHRIKTDSDVDLEKEDLIRVKKLINVDMFKDGKMKLNLYPPFDKIEISPFLYLLCYFYKKKFGVINKKERYNNYGKMKYIFNYYIDSVNNYFINDISKKVNNNLLAEEKTNKTNKSNINFNIYYLKKTLVKEIKNIIKQLDEKENNSITPTSKSFKDMIRCFFYTLFVYNKIINNNLIKYSQPNNNEKNKICNIPFSYDIDNSFLNGFNALMVTSPIKVIKNIKGVHFNQNILVDICLFEIGKASLFNKEIETLKYDRNKLRAYYCAYFTFTQRIFENYNIKEISISNNNYITEDIDILLCEIIKHFKNLEIINISNNELKSGIKNFCIELKKLYCVNKCKIEKLNFSNCILDNKSIYELSELLKCKKCKIKSLNLNKNNLKDALKFFTSIKKNKSLEELYVGESKINNNMIKKINKIISLHKNLEEFDLEKNFIKSLDQLTRIVYRSKVIKKCLVENNNNVNSTKDRKILHLNFLNISQNQVDYFSYKFFDHIKNIASSCSLKTLDCSGVFLKAKPDLFDKQPKQQKSKKTQNEKSSSEIIEIKSDDANLIKDKKINIVSESINLIKKNEELENNNGNNHNREEYNNIFENYNKEKNDNLNFKNFSNNSNDVYGQRNKNKAGILEDHSKINLNQSKMAKISEEINKNQNCKIII